MLDRMEISKKCGIIEGDRLNVIHDHVFRQYDGLWDVIDRIGLGPSMLHWRTLDMTGEEQLSRHT